MLEDQIAKKKKEGTPTSLQNLLQRRPLHNGQGRQRQELPLPPINRRELRVQGRKRTNRRGERIEKEKKTEKRREPRVASEKKKKAKKRFYVKI